MQLFWLGALGAIAPELLRMWESRHHALVRPKSFWPVSLAFAALGGVVAVLFADSAKSAFVLGVATPFMISGLTRQAARMSSPSAPQSDQTPGAVEDDGQINVEIVEGIGVPTIARRLAIYASLL